MGVEPRHQDDPAAMPKQRHGPFEIGLARGIPIDVHALRREITDRRSNVLGFIIDSAVCAQFQASPDLLCASRGDNESIQEGRAF